MQNIYQQCNSKVSGALAAQTRSPSGIVHRTSEPFEMTARLAGTLVLISESDAHIDAISAIEAMTAVMAIMVPRYTQIYPARPPSVSAKTLDLVSRSQNKRPLLIGQYPRGFTHDMAASHVLMSVQENPKIEMKRKFLYASSARAIHIQNHNA